MTRPSERLKSVKFPTTAFNGLTGGLKLRNIKPLKQLARKLSKSLPQSKLSSSNKASASPITTRQTESSAEAANLISPFRASASGGFPFLKDSKGSRIAFTLLMVRPWVLVIGLWAASMLSAAVAIEGLISPRKLLAELPTVVETAPVVKTSSTQAADQASLEVEQGSQELDSPAAIAATAAEDGAAEDSVIKNSSQLPIWPVVALVGTCAAGCLVISRRRAMVRLSIARSRGLRRSSSKAEHAKAELRTEPNGELRGKVRKVRINSAGRSLKPLAEKPTLKSLVKGSLIKSAVNPASSSAQSPKDRPRRSQPATAQNSASRPASRVLASRATAQQAAPNSRVSQPSRAPRKSPSFRTSRQSGRQSVVSVVPASEAHSLDWQEGSLAHRLDVRSQRSVS
jgi:hypothetical protein